MSFGEIIGKVFVLLAEGNSGTFEVFINELVGFSGGKWSQVDRHQSIGEGRSKELDIFA